MARRRLQAGDRQFDVQPASRPPRLPDKRQLSWRRPREAAWQRTIEEKVELAPLDGEIVYVRTASGGLFISGL